MVPDNCADTMLMYCSVVTRPMLDGSVPDSGLLSRHSTLANHGGLAVRYENETTTHTLRSPGKRGMNPPAALVHAFRCTNMQESAHVSVSPLHACSSQYNPRMHRTTSS